MAKSFLHSLNTLFSQMSCRKKTDAIPPTRSHFLPQRVPSSRNSSPSPSLTFSPQASIPPKADNFRLSRSLSLNHQPSRRSMQLQGARKSTGGGRGSSRGEGSSGAPPKPPPPLTRKSVLPYKEDLYRCQICGRPHNSASENMTHNQREDHLVLIGETPVLHKQSGNFFTGKEELRDYAASSACPHLPGESNAAAEARMKKLYHKKCQEERDAKANQALEDFAHEEEDWE